MILFKKALKHLIRCSDFEEAAAMEMAIEAVAKSQDDGLARMLTDYLMGDNDGFPKVFHC